MESGQRCVCNVDVRTTDDDGRLILAGLKGVSGGAYFDNEDESLDLIWFLPDDERLRRKRMGKRDKFRGAFYIPKVWVSLLGEEYDVKWR